MSVYTTAVRWRRKPDERFLDGRYSRAHEWAFDGGARVPASASPHVVRLPFSDPVGVDPEEAWWRRWRAATCCSSSTSPSNLGVSHGMKNGMNRQEILDRLRENERALRARGVTHAALFGSRARGDERPESDTDIMIEVDPEAGITVYDYVGLKEYIAGLFDGGVDVVNRDGLKPHVRPAATADAVYAF